MKNPKADIGRKATGSKSKASRHRTVPGSRTFSVVGIGASAGGLEAFTELLRHLPEKVGMAYVLVQHLDPTQSGVLQEILARAAKIPVSEVTDGEIIQRDRSRNSGQCEYAQSGRRLAAGTARACPRKAHAYRLFPPFARRGPRRPDLDGIVRNTIETAIPHEQEVQAEHDRYLMRVRPYKTWNNKIEGAVITFLDIDAIRLNLAETRLQ